MERPALKDPTVRMYPSPGPTYIIITTLLSLQSYHHTHHYHHYPTHAKSMLPLGNVPTKRPYSLVKFETSYRMFLGRIDCIPIKCAMIAGPNQSITNILLYNVDYVLLLQIIHFKPFSPAPKAPCTELPQDKKVKSSLLFSP